MDSFNLKMAQEYDIKLEDNFTDNNELVSMKRSPCDEQDSSQDSNTPGSPLPPRKRAKTQEEKEQRRIERIMRNRQAAHASREKKRKHLEMLESKCAQLERENSELLNSSSSHNFLKLRVQQLEAAIRTAQRSGDLESLSSVLNQQPVAPVEGAAASTSSSLAVPSETNNGNVTGKPARQVDGGSPVPSLVDDCASPDALVIKSEEDNIFMPHSLEKSPMDPELDIYGMMNFNFDSNPATAAGTLTFSESSSKSRHPAVLTPLSVDSYYV